MKKREILIVVLLIAFGFIYNAVQKGKVKFVDDFSRYFNERHLISEQYEEFPQAGMVFPAPAKIIISNPAGEIIIDKSADDQVHLLAVYRIYYTDPADLKKISRNAVILTETQNNELNISAAYSSAFPYQRLRIHFELQVPEAVALAVKNREGNISIRHRGQNVFIQQENGNVNLEDISSSVQLEIIRGRLNVKDIAGNIAINARQSDIWLENVSALRLKGRHGNYSLKHVKGSVSIEHAYGNIILDDAEQAEIFGRHSKITVRNIKNGVNLSNAFQDVFLEDIFGDVRLSSRSSRMEIRHVNSRNMVIENSFADIIIADYSGETLNVRLKNGNFAMQVKTLAARMSIESKHARINLDLGVLADPTFNIKTSHGRIYNSSAIALDVFGESNESFANRRGQKPEIIINNVYGDIYLK